MSINMTTFTYPVELSVTEQPIKLTISNLMYQAHGSDTGGAVSSVNGQTGTVNLSANDVGAATSEQGAKADSALQPSDVSTAGKTGSYNDLTNKPNITGTLLAGLTTVAASAITATDSIIGALSKLQASVDTKADAANTLLLLSGKQNKLPTDGLDGQFLAHDLTFKTPAGDSGTRGNSFGTYTGLQLGTFIPNNLYDNSINAGNVTNYNQPIGTTHTVPVVFREDFKINEMGVSVVALPGTAARPLLRLAIYASHPVHGYPHERLWTNADTAPEIASTGYNAVSLDYTFLKDTVYWIQISHDCITHGFNAVNSISFGQPSPMGIAEFSAIPTSTRANVLYSRDAFGLYFGYKLGVNTDTPQPLYYGAFVNNTQIPCIYFKAATL